MEEIMIWILRYGLFSPSFHTTKSWWDSSQLKILTIEKVASIIVIIKKNYTDKLKLNQANCTINHSWYIVQHP